MYGEGSISQNTSIKKYNIKPLNDIWRCWEVSETTFMDTMPGFIWCYTRTPRGGDRTGRSKIKHYRRINECWGQQEERWRAAHVFERRQQPWNEMVWILIRILKISGMPGEAAVVRTSWKKNCAGSRDLGLSVTCQGLDSPPPKLWNEDIVSVNPPKSLLNPIFTDKSIILSLYCFWSAFMGHHNHLLA